MTTGNELEGSVDLLLKGGHVIDPANGLDAELDVAIAGSKIARVAPNIAVSAAGRVVDVSSYVVTPGISDIHTHVYTFPPRAADVLPGCHMALQLVPSVAKVIPVGRRHRAGDPLWTAVFDGAGTISRASMRFPLARGRCNR